MDDDVTEYPTRRTRLYQCQTCGRQFNGEVLNRHQAICRKVSHKTRKVFDAGRQRATDSDVPYKATKKTAQIYNGEVRAQDDRSKYGRKPNWREKHRQLIQSIREARSVTRAMKQGGPLPAFRPSEVPSDYVNCPYCRRNFNRNAAERHIPFCQSQHGRKQSHQNARLNQQFNRGRSLPPTQPQQQSPYRQQQQQQSYSTSTYSGSQDVYENSYKHINSAPMVVRRNRSEYQEAPIPPPRQASGGNPWGYRKLLGIGSKPQRVTYAAEDEYYYEQPVRRPVQQQQQPVLMRTGRTEENTHLNVRARQRTDEGNAYQRRVPVSSSYGQPRYQYAGNNHHNSTRSSTVYCDDCGNRFNQIPGKYCPHCGSKRY